WHIRTDAHGHHQHHRRPHQRHGTGLRGHRPRRRQSPSQSLEQQHPRGQPLRRGRGLATHAQRRFHGHATLLERRHRHDHLHRHARHGQPPSPPHPPKKRPPARENFPPPPQPSPASRRPPRSSTRARSPCNGPITNSTAQTAAWTSPRPPRSKSKTPPTRHSP